MRLKIGIAGILGFGLSVTVAVAQGPGQRGARLLAPRAADTPETPVYARAAAESLPDFPSHTPVASPAGKSNGPMWLGGRDSQVRPAGATSLEKQQPRSASLVTSKDEPSMVSRGLEKLKSTFTSPPSTASATAEQTNASTPFRGTGPAGQPVYAGPPAYRWYGWGSVTPGANPYAPTGQFPRASANWYSITGATPGAFPTQVVDPYRLNTGTEPPVYVTPPTPNTPPSATYSPPPMPNRQQSATPGQVVPRASSAPAGVETPRTMPVTTPELFTPPPTLTPIPSVGAAVPVITVPTISMPPGLDASAMGTPLAVAETELAGSRVIANNPLTLAPMIQRPTEAGAAMPPLPTLPVVPGVSTAPQLRPVIITPGSTMPPAPAPLPISVTDDQPKWQPTATSPSRSDWNPAGGKPQDRP
ncbi:MAG: hypothetical protein C0467_00580 [Planctomycetaceae bacterium]|nr:hypothetical protein [Planctomycetaceae bacterium]